MAKRGRKSKKDVIEENLDRIEEMARYGANEADIAKSLGISVSTWEKYKNEFSQLKEVLKNARQDLVVEIKSALVKRALGFNYEEKKQYITEDEEDYKKKHTEITTKYCPPDVGAINSALQNFDDNWYRDKRQIELKRQELELRKQMANDKEWE